MQMFRCASGTRFGRAVEPEVYKSKARSSGFFRSTEFGERGYWSYRYYHGVLGRRPQYAEFVTDMRRLSGFLTPAEEEANRVVWEDRPVTIRFAVAPSNAAPVARDVTVSLNEDGTLVLDLATFGSDAEGDGCHASGRRHARPFPASRNRSATATCIAMPSARAASLTRIRGE